MFFFFEMSWEDFLKELPFFENPKNDNEIMLNLQFMFLSQGSKSAQTKLWLKSIEISKKIIIKERSEKGFFLSDEDLEEKALAATEYVLRRYSKRIDNHCWAVRKSFFSAIYNGVRHALYYRSKGEALYEKIKKEAVYADIYSRENHWIGSCRIHDEI